MRTKFKKALVSLIVLVFSFLPIFAAPARAQWVDIVQSAKELGGDTLAWIMINKVIERMTASTVNWINTGFKGSPAYVTDPDAYFKDLGDKLAGQYIYSNPNLNFLCGPISAKIRIALTKNYIQEEQWQCTLTDVGKNMEDFMGNFENGGWDNFFELTQRDQNNPIGAYLQAQNQLDLQLSTARGNLQQELAQGNGFLSFKKCRAGAQVASTDKKSGMNNCEAVYNACVKEWSGNQIGLEQCNDKLNECDQRFAGVKPGDCAESDKETVTPGSVIQNQLNKALGSGSDKLQVADEINEIVSALLNQVVSQVVGGIGSGLRGMSQKSPTEGNSLTERLSTNPKLEGYFCLDSDDPNDPTYDGNPEVCSHPETPNLDFTNDPIPPVPDPSEMFPPGTVITIPGGSTDTPSGDSSSE